MSASKRYFAEELERQALLLEGIPEEYLSRIHEATIEAEYQRAKAESVRNRSRLNTMVAAFAMSVALAATAFSSLTILNRDETPQSISGDSQLTSLLAGFSIALVAALFLSLFRNVKVSVSSDEEIAESEGDEFEYRTVKSKLFGLEFTTKVKSKGEDKTAVIDDALLASSNASWKDALINAKSVIVRENSRLAARSRGNLAVGISVAIVGVLYLLLVVFFPSIFPSSDIDGFSDWLPRFSLFFFMQLFAVFFLRLYVGNEKRIQRNVEEITNLYLRIASGTMPLDGKGVPHSLSEKLAIEDRSKINVSTGKRQSPDQMFFLISEVIKLGKDLK